MDYKKQQEKYISFFKQWEKPFHKRMIGAEFEHFIVSRKSLESVSYEEENGVHDLLKAISKKGWEKKYEGIHLLGLKKNGSTITLEPGSQCELSLKPAANTEQLKCDYLKLTDDLVKTAAIYDYCLLPVGYHPVTKIEEISWLPKTRYKLMSDYLGKKGKFAHNMMKGTASIQVALDYFSEEDFSRKFKVSYLLAPLFSFLFDNTPFFEGNLNKHSSVRMKIWQNCDGERCGLIPGVFDKELFGYQDYADYILGLVPILLQDENGVAYPYYDKLAKTYEPDSWNSEQFLHTLSMCFPDVRAKQYVEIRYFDALPYPLNISLVAVVEDLFYKRENLEELYNLTKHITDKDYKSAFEAIPKKGLEAKIGEISLNTLNSIIINILESAVNKCYINPVLKVLKDARPYKENYINQKESAIKKHLLKISLKPVRSYKKCVNHLV